MLTPAQRQQRARIAALRRYHGDDPKVDAEATAFKTDRLADYIQKTVDAAPKLTTDQRDRLAMLLRGGQVD